MNLRSLVQRLLALTRAAASTASWTTKCWRIWSWRSGTRWPPDCRRRRRARGGAPQFWRRRADEGRASRPAQRALARHAGERRPLRTPAAGARSGLCRRRRSACMAIGIGANTAMFSLVDAVLLKPLPYPEPDRIVRVMGGADPDVAQRDRHPQFRRLEAAEHIVRGAVGDARAQRRADRPRRAVAAGGHARVGRLLRGLRREGARSDAPSAPDEDQPGAAPVVVLSHAAWQTRFGGDPVHPQSRRHARRRAAPGRRHPAGRRLRSRGRPASGSRSCSHPSSAPARYHWLGAVGRLKARREPGTGAQEMRAVSASLVELQPPFKKTWSVAVDPFDQTLVGDSLRASIYVAFGAVVMVLLIAARTSRTCCWRRASARSKEMAVRAALGASRGRLVAQMLTESLVLCLLGGVARRGARLPARSRPRSRCWPPSLPPTATVGAGSAGARLRRRRRRGGLARRRPAAVAAELVGPAVAGAEPGRARIVGSREGVRRAIVVAEVAVSLVLICGAVLMFKSLLKLQRVDAGVRIDNVITMSADLSLTAYPDAERATRFIDAVGGTAAGGARRRAGRRVDRRAAARRQAGRRRWACRARRTASASASSGSIRATSTTLDIPVLAGRGITDRDRAGAPRVVDGQRGAGGAAGRAVRDERPGREDRPARRLHRRYENRGQLGKPEDVEIVGVIRNERVQRSANAVQEVVYVPLAQAPRREIKLIVRTRATRRP